MYIEGYEQFEEIGRGGFAKVWKAYNSNLNRWDAIKVLTFDFLDDKALDAFKRESQAMGSVSEHPNIVTVHGNGITEDGRMFIVMQLFSEGTLADRIREAPLTIEETLKVGIKISSALASAHDAGILHRDLKPNNIFMSKYGQPALGDFGIARSEQDRTTTAASALTVHYAPPEVLRGDSATVRSDIYSLGATFWALLEGRKPFAGDGQVSVATAVRILNEEPERISRTDCPATLRKLISEMMAKDAADRPATAIDIAFRLQAIQRTLGYDLTDAMEERVGGEPPRVPNGSVGSPSSDLTVVRTERRPAEPEEPQHSMTFSRPVEPVIDPERDTDSEVEAQVEPPPVRRGVASMAIGGAAVVLIAALAYWGFTSSNTDDPVLPDTTQGFVVEDDIFDFPIVPAGVAVDWSGDDIEVSWDMSDAVEGDLFRAIRVDVDAPDDPVSEGPDSPIVVADIGEGETPCFEVVMVRAGRISAPSATVCASAA